MPGVPASVLDVEGPRIAALGGANSQGQVEVDFQGAFVTENLAGVQLRQAYWEVRNESFRVLVGQHWDVISPLYPATLNYSVVGPAVTSDFDVPSFVPSDTIPWPTSTSDFSIITEPRYRGRLSDRSGHPPRALELAGCRRAFRARRRPGEPCLRWASQDILARLDSTS